jgi:hypothetical protein
MISNGRGIQMRVFGPRSSAKEAEGAGYAVSAETARQLVELFKGHLSQHKTGPVQMLVDAPHVPPSVVNLSRFYGKAAVAHVLRAPPSGDVPALVGIVVLLPGVDKDADDAAIRAIETSRDKSGNALPLPPKAYQALRDDVRPLLALLFFNEEAVHDVSLRLLGVTLAEAFFDARKIASENSP